GCAPCRSPGNSATAGFRAPREISASSENPRPDGIDRCARLWPGLRGCFIAAQALDCAFHLRQEIDSGNFAAKSFKGGTDALSIVDRCHSGMEAARALRQRAWRRG